MMVTEVYIYLSKREKTFSDVLYVGSTVAQYTGQTLHHRVIENPFFQKRDYTSALVQSFLGLDRELIKGKTHTSKKKK